MPVRDQNLDSIGELFATFAVRQTAGADDLTDADIGNAVTITDNYEAGPAGDNDIVLGKLIDLTLEDGDDGNRAATVQIGGVCTLPTASPYPEIGNRVIGGANGTVKQAAALGGNDPAGGNIARGTVIAVNGTIDCTLILN